MAYSDKVVDHYNNPRNVGSLDKKDSNVGTGLVGAPDAQFAATWQLGAPLPPAEPGSLAFFLTERYCLYAAAGGAAPGQGERLYRGRIAHAAWPLREVELLEFQSDLIEQHGLPAPAGAPVLHAGGPLSVDLWRLCRV